MLCVPERTIFLLSPLFSCSFRSPEIVGASLLSMARTCKSALALIDDRKGVRVSYSFNLLMHLCSFLLALIGRNDPE